MAVGRERCAGAGRRRRRAVPKYVWLCCLLAGWGIGVVRADIYAYIDAAGVPHFSNVAQDSRYRLFLRQPPVAPALRPPHPVPALPARRQVYAAEVAALARDLQVEAALLHAVITAESAYDPAARSPKGAMGLMQLMPETARRYSVSDPFDPRQNLRGGARYLRDLLRRYDQDLQLTLAAYNAGEAAVARHGNRIPPYPETRAYVPLVLGWYERYRRLPAYGAPGGTVVR